MSRTITVMENSLFKTFTGTRRQQPRHSGSDLSRHGSACQPQLLSMIRAKDLLLLLLLRHSQPWANSKKARTMEAFFLSYLCELLTAAEFFTEGAELCSDPLIGPVQLFGWKHGIFLCTPQYVNVAPLRLDTLLQRGGGGGGALGLH